MAADKTLEKLESLLKEELWGRIAPKDVSVNKFRTLDEFYNTAAADGAELLVAEKCREHLANYSGSVFSMYLLGLVSCNKNTLENKSYLIDLLNIYVNAQKWAVVELITEKILEFGENRVAFRALALALEKQKRVKDAIPIWEDLIRINRNDAEVARKLSVALADDKLKSLSYMKLAIEGFIRELDFQNASEVLSKLVEVSPEDLPYYEKIDRLLSEAQERDLAVSLLKKLYDHFKDSTDESIVILKKLLRHNKDDIDSRKKIIQAYLKKYEGHSQLDQFMSMSKLVDFKAPVKNAIEAFENNIVFDKGNYVYHRAWGLGLIKEINNSDIFIDFRGKPDHKMSVQMALQSLTAIGPDHFYVKQHENPEELKNLFEKDFNAFFRLLIFSFGKKITVLAVKKELVPAYVEEKGWTRWWNKARASLKKDPELAFSDMKKDEIYVREKPVSYFDEIFNRFMSATSFSPKLSASIDIINNVDVKESAGSAEAFISYFISASKEGSNTKTILSYFILSSFQRYFGGKIEELEEIKKDVVKLIKESRELAVISAKITSYDNKKDFANFIREIRPDWMSIHRDFLFETPIRIHKYVFNNLVREHGYNDINRFVERVVVGAKEFPEVFLWVARNILTGTWNYEWLDYSRKNLVLSLFRLLNEMKRIEIKNVRVKNMLLELIFGSEYVILKKIVSDSELALCAKIYDIANSSGYADQWQMEKFMQIIKERYPDFTPQQLSKDSESVDYDAEEIFVLKSGYDKKAEELSQMLNVELASLTKQLSEASDLSADMRENVEYSALMEKQAILKKSISKLDSEIKKARIIDLSKISVESVVPGCKVVVKNLSSGEKTEYSILGPWDADYDRNILSYRSEMARALLKKKIGEEIAVGSDDNLIKYKLETIEPFNG